MHLLPRGAQQRSERALHGGDQAGPFDDLPGQPDQQRAQPVAAAGHHLQQTLRGQRAGQRVHGAARDPGPDRELPGGEHLDRRAVGAQQRGCLAHGRDHRAIVAPAVQPGWTAALGPVPPVSLASAGWRACSRSRPAVTGRGNGAPGRASPTASTPVPSRAGPRHRRRLPGPAPAAPGVRGEPAAERAALDGWLGGAALGVRTAAPPAARAPAGRARRARAALDHDGRPPRQLRAEPARHLGGADLPAPVPVPLRLPHRRRRWPRRSWPRPTPPGWSPARCATTGVRVDYATIGALHLANPDWDIPVVSLSANNNPYFYSDASLDEMEVLGAATARAIERTGRRAVLLASNSLSHLHWDVEPELPEDMARRAPVLARPVRRATWRCCRPSGRARPSGCARPSRSTSPPPRPRPRPAA